MKTKPKSRLDELLAEISPLEQAQTNARMQIAARIADAMRAKNWKNKDLLEKVGKKHPSVISKWLSGTHNFTIDTLVELEQVLEIELLNIEDRQPETTTMFRTSVRQNAEVFIPVYSKRTARAVQHGMPFQLG